MNFEQAANERAEKATEAPTMTIPELGGIVVIRAVDITARSAFAINRRSTTVLPDGKHQLDYGLSGAMTIYHALRNQDGTNLFTVEDYGVQALLKLPITVFQRLVAFATGESPLAGSEKKNDEASSKSPEA